jgi:uncharacterized protein
MKCPVCKDPDLVMTDRQGIEIDYCPQCRGIWLDRGELDKIIERSTAQASRDSSSDERQNYRYESDRHHDDDDHYKGKHRKKKGGFLEDLFDFD